jgi:hypothetical protein
MRSTLGPLLLLLSTPLACSRAAQPAAEPDPWEACLRPSVIAGVARETAPDLDLEIEGVRVVTGSLGQRGPDVDASGDVLRIAAVGGELTFGTGLQAEQAWPQALANQIDTSLISAGKHVEALNLGTVAASPAEVLALATERALTWQPWLMVVELDATRVGSSQPELVTRLQALRAAAAPALCGVLVAVSLPPGEPLDEAGASVTALRFLIDEARRAGFSTLDLREVFAGQASESLAAGATPKRRGHATAHAQGLVFEAVKRRLFDSGLLTAAFEAHAR